MIFDSNTIDIIGERKDGGIEFIIISSGGFDDSIQQQTLLLDKIENYLIYFGSCKFEEEFPLVSKKNRWIILRRDEKLMSMFSKLFKKKEDVTANTFVSEVNNTNLQNSYITVKEKVTMDEYGIPEFQGDYAKTIFLYAMSKPSPICLTHTKTIPNK